MASSVLQLVAVATALAAAQEDDQWVRPALAHFRPEELRYALVGAAQPAAANLTLWQSPPETPLLRRLQQIGSTVTVLRPQTQPHRYRRNTRSRACSSYGRQGAWPPRRAGAAILVLTGPQPRKELNTLIDALQRSERWWPQNPTVLVQPEGMEPHTELLEDMWEIRSGRVALLMWSGSRTTFSARLETYNKPEKRTVPSSVHGSFPVTPFESTAEKFYSESQGRFVSWRLNRFPSHTRCSDPPPLSHPSFPAPFSLHTLPNLHGCPLRIAALPWTVYVIDADPNSSNKTLSQYDGMDIRIVAAISEKLNFSLKFLPNIEVDWTASATMVRDGYADVTIGAQYPDPNVYMDLDATTVYWTDTVVWWVPTGKPMPRWMSLGVVFTPKIWIYTLSSFLVSSLVLSIVNKYGLKGRKALPGVFLAYLMLLGQSAPLMTKNPSSRLALITWLIGGLIVNAAYQCELISFLTTPRMFPALNSLADLVASPLPVGLVSDGDEPFEFFVEDKFMPLLSRSVLCPNMTTCMDRMAFHGDMIVGVDKMFVELHMDRYVTEDGRPLVRHLAEPVFSYGVLMYLRPHGALLPGVQFVLAALSQAGLVAYWWSQVVSGRQLKGGAAGSGQGPGQERPLTLTNLQGAFLLLGVGLGLAGVALAVEVARARLQPRPAHARSKSRAYRQWIAGIARARQRYIVR